MTDHSVRATYRLQLGPGLGFADAAALLDQLAALGVSHLYLSPILQARAGSSHGYDVADPSRVSDDLGGVDGLRALARAARERGLGLVADLVPNHLGVGADNPLWEALLAEGRGGASAEVFDVDWSPPLPGAEGKVILPVLGAPYGQELHAGHLRVVDGEHPRLRYHEHAFPLSAASAQALRRSGGVDALAGTPGEPATWTRMHALLEQQHYRLVHWRVGDALVNYRRFFAINELAAVRVEDAGVYERTHATVLALLADGTLDGLRIDHVDGLTDPGAYLERLRADVGDAWIVVEKILAAGESLPAWPVDGSTGYEFLADTLQLFVDPRGETALTSLARRFDAWPADGLAALERRSKRDVLAADLAADVDRLTARVWALAQEDRSARDVRRADCAAAVVALVGALGVYRTYVRVGEAPRDQDVRVTDEAFRRAHRDAPAVPAALWTHLEHVLTGRAGDGPLARETLRRFQQLSSAATAKGVEDTLLYRQFRLAALDEVGVDPGEFGRDVAAFHAANVARAAAHPQGMLTTATHDTKRGEDVRLRIAALSERPERWGAAVEDWAARHRRLVAATPAGPAPDPAIVYLAYQTLVGIWPLRDARARLGELARRLRDYLVKAAREGGLRTSWQDPDAVFEDAIGAFVDGVLDPADPDGFLDELDAWCDGVADIAMTHGLAQVLLRCTSPGVPDTYQGDELWDDALVDPDNRRPVDFALRARLLAALDDDPPDLDALVAARRDGRVKLWVLSRTLRARGEVPGCYGPAGAYLPLEVEGRFAAHVVAFARTDGGRAAVTIAPRLVGTVLGGRAELPRGACWADTALRLPPALAGGGWRDALGGPGAAAGERIALGDVLRTLPVALLVR